MERTEVIVHGIVTESEALKHSEYIGSARDGLGNLVHVYNVDNDQLLHYGTVGMKWGKRRAYNSAINKAADHQEAADDHAESASSASKKASKNEAKYNKKVAKGKGDSRSAQRKLAKMNKYNDLAKSHNADHEYNTQKANEYIKKASKLGRSKDTPFRDEAKKFINAIGNDNSNPNQAVANYKTEQYADRLERRNAAAKKANALRDKNKG